MLKFLIKRILYSIPVFIVVATLTFFILYCVPGGPFDSEKKLPPEILLNIETKYHLNLPVWQQYYQYMKGLAQGDLGPSYKYTGRSVNEIIADTFPVSIKLGLLSFSVAISFGLFFGTVAAIYKESWIDRLSMTASSGGISLPTFVLGSLLIFIFSILFHLLPPALWEGWSYTLLPSLTLGLGSAAYIARLVRSSLLENVLKDFVRTARASGIPEKKIVFKYLLRNSISPVISISGPLIAGLLTGSFIVEYLFSIPGMGRYFVTAVTNRDYPLIMGVTLVYAVVIVVANIMVDLVSSWIDPRMREHER
ncbi:MAG: ABC transporter permease [Nitrospirae bacterium]|nr:ABC transporter permease [Nitrospirota bacterium]MBI3594654.1 ABC transporter permease [Nitrospirota bacterium]